LEKELSKQENSSEKVIIAEIEKGNNKTGVVDKIFKGSMILFLSAMVIFVFINAIMRYIFKTSIPVSEEYARFLFMWTVFLGVIAAFQDKSHVSVTILIDHLNGKVKKAVYVIGQLITVVTMILLIIGGAKYTLSASTYKSVATGINYGIIVSGFLIMIAGSTVIIIKDTFRNLKEMDKGGTY